MKFLNKRFLTCAFSAGVLSFSSLTVWAQNDDATTEEKPAAEPVSTPAPNSDRPPEQEAERPATTPANTEGNRPQQGEGQDRQSQDGEANREGGNRRNNQNPNRPGRPAQPTQPNKPSAKFQLESNEENLILQLHSENDPRQIDISVTENQDFVTDISLLNVKEREVNKLRFIIDYNPAFVNPRIFNDSALLPYIDGQPKVIVDRNLGQIVYLADLKTPYIDQFGTIMFITWEALQPVLHTTIRFGRHRTLGHTDVFFDDLPMLGEPQEPGDGTIPLSVSIIPSDPAEALMMKEEPQLYVGSDERVGGVELRLVPPKELPRVGEPFTIDIDLDNSAYSKVDGVSLMINFDGSVLEILDLDYDNWITLGTNISDGPYRERFPFNFHMANAVYPTRGIIEYRAGTSNPDDLTGISGTVATIHAVAKKPIGETTVEFVFGQRKGMRSTEVLYLGQDVLGDITVRDDGIRNIKFSVLPERQTSESASSK